MEQPITREEQYLSAIADSSGTLPDAPQTREEMFLAAIAGADVIPPDPVTRKEAYLKAILDSGGGGGGDDDEWKRPADWPDLDSIQIPNDFEGVYMTYDLRRAPNDKWLSVGFTMANGPIAASLERGHLANGAFVVDETYTITTGSTLAYHRMLLDPENGDVQLFRMYGVSGDINLFQFKDGGSLFGSTKYPFEQPCVEITGRFTHLTGITYSESVNNRYYWGTYWLEKDSRRCGGSSVTTLKGAWKNCYNLQCLDLSGWDTSNWTVTSLEECWYYCHSLKTLDLSKWNTKNWEVTTLKNCWDSCTSLRELDLSAWDTSKWAVSTMTSVWNSCASLKKVKVSGWDTTKWTPTSIQLLFGGCPSIETIEGTESWAFVENVTTVASPMCESKCLRNYKGMPTVKTHSYNNCITLTRESLLSMIATLPTIESAATITLHATSKKVLTDDEIAVATAKGWTVA